MRSRIRAVLDEALRFVLVRSAAGVGLGVVGGLVGALATHHTKTDAIALAGCGTMVGAGAAAILLASLLDPMGTENNTGGTGRFRGQFQGGFFSSGRGGSPAIERWNDHLFASGAVVIALGVVIAVIFSLSGASPITPLRSMR